MGRIDIGPHARTEQLRSRGVSSSCIEEGNNLHDDRTLIYPSEIFLGYP